MTKSSAIRTAFVFIFVTLTIAFSALLYFSYQDYIHPKHVYGRWIEVGAPPYQTEVLTLNSRGVYRNDRLIATHFDFDGKRITVQTGNGDSIYQLAGTFKSPQLKRLEPNSPTQRFIKEGYENTIDMSGGGSAKNRRAALSDHFGNK
ncbi:DUF2850 domain-containing protein [Vibrio europaeus]|uniref:DUF2850 domain-containing protein n=1 Tax=Vibrio europaeus TaxID=300876 RepID=A0A178J7Z2_9VIBR|nr:DUF2850 domain-containing protein [Vibrio europaeus]MDC5705309.1 DUF2850 domain-containing protein [Vibrio europaeus]MDC5710588.1 DUF2850 domain-containing protein [Vibrio europaeus]MDC5715678.1 DUF2850 domain-containing protein [Vibrio europaeus]MDC5719839.1 DUF2850 domain-containing protein [Vibrio europaeus]MDC5724273.1 DUF2850 domain-containing protein [Vibrio europaeus]